MDTATFLQAVLAVIVGNAACAMFAVAMIAANRLEKKGVPQDELPIWIYLCAMAPLLLAAAGAYIGYSLA